ncbi:hypothetical protein Ancab_037450 [Ancistrocladus abbreviatus]
MKSESVKTWWSDSLNNYCVGANWSNSWKSCPVYTHPPIFVAPTVEVDRVIIHPRGPATMINDLDSARPVPSQ